MKRLFLAMGFILGLGLGAMATPSVWKSSNTATADTTQVLSTPTNYLVGTSTIREGGHGVYHGICINTGTAGTFTIYNSSASAANPIAATSTASVGCLTYDVGISSGLTYTNSATANVTVLYMCY